MWPTGRASGSPLFVSGCTHACPECFNPEAWDFSYGQPFTQAEAGQILQALEKPYIKGLSLLGASPSTPPTRPPCWILCVRCGPDSRKRTSGATPAICLRTWPPAAWGAQPGTAGAAGYSGRRSFCGWAENLGLRFRGPATSASWPWVPPWPRALPSCGTKALWSNCNKNQTKRPLMRSFSCPYGPVFTWES